MKQANRTPLPPKPKRVTVESLVVKEAVGFALWNGQFEGGARLYLAKMTRADRSGGLVRYFGGTAVPQSPVSSWNQSLIRLQDYVEESLEQEVIVDFSVLHRGYYFNQKMYSDPKLPGSEVVSQTQHMAAGLVSHSAPGYEIHGLLKVSNEFVERHHGKFVELRVSSDGRVLVEPYLAFNNNALVSITRHLLACLFYSDLRCSISINANVDRDDAPYMDSSPISSEDLVG